MNIGILARGLSETIGGVKQYIYDLTNALVRVDKNNKYFVFYNKREFLGTYPQAEEIAISVGNKFLWDHYYFPKVAKKYPLDILFCPKSVIPLGVKIKSIVTIHDLMYFPMPWKYNFKEYKFFDTIYMRIFIPRSLKQSVQIVVDSENTRADIISLFKIPESKISVVYLGVSEFVKKQLSEESIREILHKNKVRRPFIFYSGVATRRKNLQVLIRALGAIKDKIPHQLVITGGGGEKNIPLNKVIKEAEIEQRINILGTVSFDTIVALYKTADMFIFPSLYEGFGLPILEAMALECPVISSNAASLPEVAADAALMFDPNNVQQLSELILRVVNDSSLRNQLIEKGRERAKLFTWEKAAREMIKIFERAYNS